MYGNLYRRCVFLQELDASKGMRCEEENACDTKTGHFTKTDRKSVCRERVYGDV